MDIILISIMGFLFLAVFLAEKIIPNVDLPMVKNWYFRAFVFNGFQALSAFFGVYLWDNFFATNNLFDLSGLNIFLQVLIGYLLVTFIYYWWHRWRHEVKFLWRYLHQFHHSPTRIEVITSFYKSPLEIIINGMLSSAILYFILGLAPVAVTMAVFATAVAELIYHMNIKTPYIMGFFFQRPEMHRLHHKMSVHHYNYADVPLWDILFGTFKNPKEEIEQTGFPDKGEDDIVGLLTGKEIKW